MQTISHRRGRLLASLGLVVFGPGCFGSPDAKTQLFPEGDPEVLEVANRATQHLYIVNPIKSFEERAASMWDTHPPIAERIAVLRGLAGQFGQDPSAIS